MAKPTSACVGMRLQISGAALQLRFVIRQEKHGIPRSTRRRATARPIPLVPRIRLLSCCVAKQAVRLRAAQPPLRIPLLAQGHERGAAAAPCLKVISAGEAILRQVDAAFAAITNSFRLSMMRCKSGATAMSTAMDVPSNGKDKTPLPSGPQSLITHKGDAPPSLVKSCMNSSNGRRSCGAWEHALILGEATRAVGAVPIQDRVQG